MAPFFELFQDSSRFMPHGMCYLWKPELLWLHVVSDGLIALAYFAIPPTLAVLILRARAVARTATGSGVLRHEAVVWAFGAFIVACGVTHLVSIWTIWEPVYWLSGGVKVVTATASVATAIMVPPLVPKGIALLEGAYRSEGRRLEALEANRVLEQRNQELALLHELTTTFGTAEALDDALYVAFQRICEVADWDCAEAWLPGDGPGELRRSDVFYTRDVRFTEFHALSRDFTFPPDGGAPQHALAGGEAVHITELADSPRFLRREIAGRVGLTEAVAVPISDGGDDDAYLVLMFYAAKTKSDGPRSIELISTVARQIGWVVSRLQSRTRLREQVKRIAEAEQRLETIVEETFEGMLVLDDRGTASFANGPAAEILDQTREEMIGRDFSDLRPGGDGDAVVKRHGDHGMRWILLREKPIEWGGARRVLLVLSDITERRNLEESLRQAQKMEAVGQLTGGVAHDFNNLLTVILSTSDFLEDSLSADQNHLLEFTREIRSAAEGGSQLVQRLLGLSRKDLIRIQPAEVEPLVEEIRTTLQRLLPNSIEIRCTIEDDSWIDVDAGAFEQIMLNLATNARDGMGGAGAIEISSERTRLPAEYAEHHPWLTSRPLVCVEVADDGQGMSPEVAARAFEPFFTTKEFGRGTGLGLAMVYGLMKQHEGLAHISSEEGVGTRVRLYFPQADRPDRPTPDRPVHEPRRDSDRPLEGIEVVVVEDDSRIRQALDLALSRLGATISMASDGREGLDLIRARDRTDVVICDVIMPVMGGIEFYRTLREEGDLRPVILTSGYSATNINDLDLDEKSTFVRKPWSVRNLVDVILSLLDRDVPGG